MCRNKILGDLKFSLTRYNLVNFLLERGLSTPRLSAYDAYKFLHYIQFLPFFFHVSFRFINNLKFKQFLFHSISLFFLNLFNQ